MQLIRTGMQIGQAVKNVHRLKQILGTFTKYGFVDIVQKLNLGRFMPDKLVAMAQDQAQKSVPERLRLAFEELGPTFVKFGQLLSTRPDLLPEDYLTELTKLQHNVQVLPFETIRAIVEKELNQKIEDAYAFFDPKPLAAASIAQVHEAKLKTGEAVVVKVQRPGIDAIIDTDISLLAFLAGLLEKYIPETRALDPKTVVDELFRSLRYELDFAVEANNTIRFSENLATLPDIVIPKVFKALSTHKILTIEKIDGIRVNDLKAIDEAGIDRKKVVDLGARAFFKAVMIDGLFHGDLHGGNWFVLPGNRLGIIDFGIVGRLSERARDQMANIVMSLLSEDYEKLCYQYAELSSAEPSIDFDAFQREVRNTIAPYLGLSLVEVNVGRVLIEATKIASRYNVRVPGEWMLLFKAIITIEGIGRTLDPNFDLLATGQDLVKDLVKHQYSKQRLMRDLTWVAKEMSVLLQMLPRQMRWLFRKLNANDFALEIRSPELRRLSTTVNTASRRLAGALAGAGLLIAGSMALQFQSGHKVGDYPLLSVILYVIGLLLLLRSALLH